MKDTHRRIIRIAGLVLMAAAICVIGYSAWNIVSAQVNTENSLQEAEQLIGDMDAYTGTMDSQPPDATLSPDDTGQPEATLAPDDINDLPDDATMAPDDSAAPADPLSTPGPTDGKNATKPNGSTKSNVIGILVFNSLGGRKVPILEGASARQLSAGAAHHPHSSKIGAVGNTVIYGHRNTVFRGFARLKVGDTISVQVPGKTYTYRIDKMAVVEPGDPQIFKAYSTPAITLVTCYPFNYVGSAPHRYIVVAVLQ